MNYKNLLKKFCERKYKKVIAVDINPSELRIAVMVLDKPMLLAEKLISKQMPEKLQADGWLFNASAFAEFLSDILKVENIKGDTIVFTAGADKIALLNLQLPYLNKNELHEAVKWEIAQALNTNVNDFYYAAGYLSYGEAMLNDVAAAVISANICKVLLEVAAEAEIMPGGIFLRSQAIEKTFAKRKNICMLCDYSAKEEITLTAFYNAVPVKQTVITDNIDDAGYLTAEINSLIKSLPQFEVQEIIINGNLKKAQYFKDLLGFPFIINDVSRSVAFAESIAANALPEFNSFAAVIGAALCLTDDNSLNLMPEQKKQFVMPRWQLYKTAASVCMAVMLLSWGWQLMQLQNIQQQIKNIDARIARLGEWPERYQQAVVKNTEINERLQTAAKLKSNKFDWHSALTDISKAIPYGCQLEKIEQSENKKQLNITGCADTMEQAVNFAEALARQTGNAKTEITELKNETIKGKNNAAFNLLLERRQ